MKRISLRLAIAILTFVIGLTATALWAVRDNTPREVVRRNDDCIPKYYAITTPVIREGWNGLLDRFQEMPLDQLPACVDESYRFVWIPTFHSPLSIRIWRSGDEQFLATKQLDGKGGYGMGQLARQEMRTLTNDEWNEFMRLLRQSGYWDMPTLDPAPLPFDGASWVIEGTRDRKQYRVARHTPSAEFREACFYLVKLSGFKTEIEKY